MKILVVTKSGDSAGLWHRFVEEGHTVFVHFDDPEIKDCANRMVQRVSLQEGLNQNPAFILFDMVGLGKKADLLRARGWNVFGGSELADEIELKREKGLEFAKKYGIKVPETQEFKKIEEAMAYVHSHPDHIVAKVDGNLSAASSFVAKDANQMVEWLDYLRESGQIDGAKFILQKKLTGVEVSTECWFSKGKPVLPFNQTMEIKKLFPGDLGPATGCMFSAVYTIPGTMPRFIEKTLKKIFRPMEEAKWTGPIDINCIVDEKSHEPVFLEWTARLGYSAIYALCAMLTGNLGEFFNNVSRGTVTRVPVASTWGTALRLCIAPYPLEVQDEKISRYIYEEIAGQPIEAPKDRNIWLCEDVKKDEEDRLVTAGIDGLVAECTGQGGSLVEAWNKSKKAFESIEVPGKFGRLTDGMDRAYKDSIKLKSWGYEVPSPSSQSSKVLA